ncbi:MAG: hypothetical protein ABEJ72_07725 [Candidatus Aenigmatarchaeota archaeon]
MAVEKGTYSTKRYILAGTVLAYAHDWLTLEEINQRAHVKNSLEPEIEVMEAMEIFKKRPYPVTDTKYQVNSYFSDLRTIGSYFDIKPGEDVRQIHFELDEEALTAFREETEVIHLLED